MTAKSRIAELEHDNDRLLRALEQSEANVRTCAEKSAEAKRQLEIARADITRLEVRVQQFEKGAEKLMEDRAFLMAKLRAVYSYYVGQIPAQLLPVLQMFGLEPMEDERTPPL